MNKQAYDTRKYFLLIIPKVIQHADEDEMKLHRYAFFLLFQDRKRFCLCEQSLFGQNIHLLDTQGACSMISYRRIKEFCWHRLIGSLMLKDLITPDNLRDKMFDKLSQALEEHCNPALSVIVEWFNFYTCWQHPNQTTSDFITLSKNSQSSVNLVPLSRIC